jgi:hypothetical protein
VWAGTDACEPVTWQECKLVPKDVQLIVPEITCSDKQELWYHEPEPVTDTRMTNIFKCEIKSTSHCKSQTRPDCKQISWNECRSGKIIIVVFITTINIPERFQSKAVVIRRFMSQHRSSSTGRNAFLLMLDSLQVSIFLIIRTFILYIIFQIQVMDHLRRIPLIPINLSGSQFMMDK